MLQRFFEENSSVALAFSGGVDSAYLLYAGKKWAKNFRAYYIETPFQPQFEREDVARLAREVGAEVTVLPFDVLTVPEAAKNDPLRCYYCKRALFTKLTEQAEKDGFPLVIDGTNASDDASDRPGMRALWELSVRSPLRECGLTKDDVRRLSKEAGLFTWDKPSYSCLATRVKTGEALTPELLHKVEAAETALFALGLSDFRVRVSGRDAKLQVTARDVPLVAAHWEEIGVALGAQFETATIDLKLRA